MGWWTVHNFLLGARGHLLVFLVGSQFPDSNCPLLWDDTQYLGAMLASLLLLHELSLLI